MSGGALVRHVCSEPAQDEATQRVSANTSSTSYVHFLFFSFGVSHQLNPVQGHTEGIDTEADHVITQNRLMSHCGEVNKMYMH